MSGRHYGLRPEGNLQYTPIELIAGHLHDLANVAERMYEISGLIRTRPTEEVTEALESAAETLRLQTAAIRGVLRDARTQPDQTEALTVEACHGSACSAAPSGTASTTRSPSPSSASTRPSSFDRAAVAHHRRRRDRDPRMDRLVEPPSSVGTDRDDSPAEAEAIYYSQRTPVHATGTRGTESL